MEDLNSLIYYLIVVGIITFLAIIVSVYENFKTERRFKNTLLTSFTGYDGYIVKEKPPICPKILTTKSGDRIDTKNLLKKDLFITIPREEWILVDRRFSSINLKPGDEVVLVDDVTRLYYLALVDEIIGKYNIYSIPGNENNEESDKFRFSFYGKVICRNKLK